MKKSVLLSATILLWAASVFSAELPPYSDFTTFSAFYQEPGQNQGVIQLYPNPVTEGRLTIKSEESFVSVQILNITGEVVFNQDYPLGTNAEVIELDKLEKGMYLVRLGFPGKSNHTAKIIVK